MTGSKLFARCTCSTCHGFLLSCKLIEIWKLKGNPDTEIQESPVWLVESGIWGVLESGIQYRKSRIPLRIGIRNPSSPDKQFQSSWNPDCLGFLYMGPNGT